MSYDVQMGPLARKVLFASCDSKKITKAHVLETTTVDELTESLGEMSLQVLPPSASHLLKGFSIIYSRQQQYFYKELEETCAKMRLMAIRPGMVPDLPAENAIAHADTITLPETFHDFETTVADLDLE